MIQFEFSRSRLPEHWNAPVNCVCRMARFRLASLKSEVSYWSRTVVRATSGLQTHCQTDGDMLTVQFSDCYVRTVRFGPFHSDRYIRTVRCHQLNSLAIRSYPMNKIWEFGNGRRDACSHTANTRRLVEHSMVGHTARCSTILVCVCVQSLHCKQTWKSRTCCR